MKMLEAKRGWEDRLFWYLVGMLNGALLAYTQVTMN